MTMIRALTTFWKTSALGILLIAALIATAPSARASQIELTANQIYTTWTNINGAFIVIAASTAIDDDWTAEFKAMPLQPFDGKTLDDVNTLTAQFRTKLNAVLVDGEHDPAEVVSLPGRADNAPSVVYLNAGVMMDKLILLLIQTDPLAFVAQFYLQEKIDDKSANDVYAQAELANRRLDAYMEENGIEVTPDEAPTEGGDN